MSRNGSEGGRQAGESPGFSESSQSEVAARTFRWDRLRLGAMGVVEVGWLAFGLLVAIEVYAAGESIRAWIAASYPIGLLLTPLGLWAVAGRSTPSATWCRVWYIAGGFGYIVAALAPNALWFAIGVVCGSVARAQILPYSTGIYARNYRGAVRGRQVSRNMMLAALSGALLSQGAGAILSADTGLFRWVYLCFAGLHWVSAFAVGRIPSDPPPARGTGSGPLRNFRILGRDRVFASVLAAWMLLGFGNLMLLPMRVEYLANDDLGLGASPLAVSLISVGVFSLSSLFSLRMVGRWFDRVPFLSLRLGLNGLLALGMAFTFFSEQLWVVAIGSLFFGLGMGGGGLTWNLWVTKLAPAGRVSDYMSLHTGLTGLRGVLAPFVGYSLVGPLGVAGLATVGLGLIAISSLGFAVLAASPLARRRFRG